DAAAVQLDLAADHEVEARVDLLLEPRLVEPHGREALPRGPLDVGAHDVQPAAAPRGAAAQHAPGHRGGLAVLEGAQARQHAAVLVAPGQVGEEVAVGPDAHRPELPGRLGAAVA